MLQRRSVQDNIDTAAHHVQFVSVTDVTDLAQAGNIAPRILPSVIHQVLFEEEDLRFIRIDDSQFLRRMIQQLPDDLPPDSSTTSCDQDRFV